MDTADRHPADQAADANGWDDDETSGYTHVSASARNPLVTRRRLVAGLLAAGGIALFMALDGAPPGVATAAAPKDPPPRPAWIDINRPIQLYSLTLPGFEPGAQTYEARRHDPGGGRRDTLALGRWETEGPYLRLSIYRHGEEPVAPAALYLEMVRRAAEQGLAVTRSGQPDRLATRFGAFDVADMTLEGEDRQHTCLGFRLTGADAQVTLSGFSCGGPGQPIQRGQLVCQLDRLDLVSAGEDALLRDFFVEAERRRDESCGGSRLSRQTAGWMEPQGAPALRGAAPEKIQQKRGGKHR